MSLRTVKKEQRKIKIVEENLSEKQLLFHKVRSRYIDLRASRESNKKYFPHN